MNAREEITRAVAVYGDPNSGVLAKAGAEGLIRSHGLDPDAALAEARGAAPRSSGLVGALRKDVSFAGAGDAPVTLAWKAGGTKVRLDMSRQEAMTVAMALTGACYGRTARYE